MKPLIKVGCALAAIGLVLTSALGEGHAQQREKKLKTAVQKTQGKQKDARESQQTIGTVADETEGIRMQYRNTLRRISALQVYNGQLAKLLEAQKEEQADIQQQIEDVTVINRQLTPLMLRMIDALDKFVELDLPFMIEARKKRVAELREMMDRSDVSESEKYRQITQTYQEEIEYGRTIETYDGQVSINGKDTAVEFLRVGRVTLVYRTKDGSSAAVWDKENETWSPLDETQIRKLREAFRIAAKQAAPDLITVPVPAPEEAKL